ncbi:MAG TPA: discoidin domain-containing protein [Bryobacteraceae bacterium]|jgi:hypothetical protein
MQKLTLALAAVAATCYANWGGGGGGSVGTGAFRAFGTGQVEMQQEDLTILLYRDRARVQVEYTLKNTGDSIDVKAGFPSLEIASSTGGYAEVRNYHLTADGKEVSFKAEKSDVGNWKTLFDPEFVDMAVGPGTSSDPAQKACGYCGLWWLTSTVHFDKNASKHIRITYQSRYQSAGGGPSGDMHNMPDRFRYLLSPAATWKGPIQQGNVTIRAVTVDPKPIVIKPAGRFQSTPNGWVWEFRNLKPTLADNIELSLNNAYDTILQRGPESRETNWYSFEGNKFFFDFHDFTATASSTAKGYSPANVADLQGNTAWVAGRNGGINESLTVTLTRPTHVDQIGIVPGYAKSEELCFANSRVQDLEVKVNNNPPVTVTLPDEFVESGVYDYKGYALINLPAYPGDARTITLTVKKVYPGTKYSDLCISELLLRKRLPRKPEVNGAR